MSWLPFNLLVCWQITLTLLQVSWIGLVIGLIAAFALPAKEFDKVVSAISHFFSDNYGEKFHNFNNQNEFMINFALLDWRIWVGMDPVALTADESTRRDQQRDWFRNYVSSQHPDDQKIRTYMSKAGNKVEMTPREYDLFMYEQLLNDPTYPFLFFPLAEERFSQIKKSLKTKPATVWFSKKVYDEYENCHYGKVTIRWPLPGENGIGILSDGLGYLVSVYDISLGKRDRSSIGLDRDVKEDKKVIPGKPSQPVVQVYDALKYTVNVIPGEPVRMEPVAVGNDAK